MYCKCEETNCINSESCKRIDGKSPVMTFKNICSEENNYKYYVKDKTKLNVMTEDEPIESVEPIELNNEQTVNN